MVNIEEVIEEEAMNEVAEEIGGDDRDFSPSHNIPLPSSHDAQPTGAGAEAATVQTMVVAIVATSQVKSKYKRI